MDEAEHRYRDDQLTVTGRDDGDPVTVSWSSPRNITFHQDGEELGYTWGEWRDMTEKEKTEALTELLWSLVDLVVDE